MEAHASAGERKLGGRVDSREAWLIAIATLVVPSISFGAPYIVIVALKPIAADLGGYRSIPAAAASLAMLGTGVGGLAMGWLAERIGTRLTVMMGAVMMCAGLDPLVGWRGVAALPGPRTSRRVPRQRRHQRTALCLHHPLVRASPRHRARPDRERAIRGRRRLAVAVRARDRSLRLAADDGGLRRAGGCADRAARRPGPEAAAGVSRRQDRIRVASAARQSARSSAQHRFRAARRRVVPVLRADGHADGAPDRAVRRSRPARRRRARSCCPCCCRAPSSAVSSGVGCRIASAV